MAAIGQTHQDQATTVLPPVVCTAEHAAGPAKAIDDMKSVYKCAWPPRPDFGSWPASWLPYQGVCDLMPRRLQQGDPRAFRQWMTQELQAQVNLECVMLDLYQRRSRSDRQVLGFLGCLAILKNAYRWGALPTVQEERQRTSMLFPDVIDKPMTEVARLHGVNPFCHFFSLPIANAIYEGDQAVHTRFHFNADPKVIRTEENFLLPFVIVENTFQPAVEAMREYCTLTEEASNSYSKARTTLPRREELLGVIQRTTVAVGKVFRAFTQGDKIDRKDWMTYVQMPTTWGLDGKVGASGVELLTFQLLDEFLHVPGECLVFTSRADFQQNMPDAASNIVNAMAISHPASRFNSYLGLEQSEDPLWKGREAILKSVHLWRLGHAHVVSRMLTDSDSLASTMDKKMEVVESIAAAAKRELLHRAQETKNQFRTVIP